MDKSPNPNATQEDEVDFEFRLGGTILQTRETAAVDHQSGEPTIKIIVYHDGKEFHYVVPFLYTFGDLKKLIAIEWGLEEILIKLSFRGKEKEDNEYLNNAGVKDNARLFVRIEKPISEINLEVPTNLEPSNSTIGEITQLMADLEEPSSKDKKPEESQEPELSRASIAIAEVRSEIDNLAEQVASLEAVINCNIKVEEKQFIALTEFLMRQLLKLDSIEAEGEEKLQRKTEVRRTQTLEDTLDTLKDRNSKIPWTD